MAGRTQASGWWPGPRSRASLESHATGRRTSRTAVYGLAAVLLLAVQLERPAGPAVSHACRFWALIGGGYPKDLLADHLRDGSISNLKRLGGLNRDGWGFASYLSDSLGRFLNHPLTRRGGPPANHPFDSDYDLAVDELRALRPGAILGHVRLGTSGHWGIPNPHPFEHEGMVFAHNGSLSEDLLVTMLTSDDPLYLGHHPPDYVNGYIDSELYFLYLLKRVHQTPGRPLAEGLRTAVREVAAQSGGCRLNFVLTDGDTLYAVRYSPGDEWDPVRFRGVGLGPPPHYEPSPYWVVASQIVGSDSLGWETLPPQSLAVFVPGELPRFYAIDTPGEESTDPASNGPADGSVGSAWPNPSRSGIRIPFRLPEGGARIRLEVWDIQGRLVWGGDPPADGARAGQLVWDGCDRHGALVPCGTYFCRIQMDGKSWERKVAVVR